MKVRYLRIGGSGLAAVVLQTQGSNGGTNQRLTSTTVRGSDRAFTSNRPVAVLQ